MWALTRATELVDDRAGQHTLVRPRQEPGSVGHPSDEDSALDRAAQLLIMTCIDSRVYPMFACLFGYGMVQMFRRQVDAGTPMKVAPPAAAPPQTCGCWSSGSCTLPCSGTATCSARTGWLG
jgi:hypothetical protein